MVPQGTESLLSYRVAQTFAITIVVFIADSRAGLRQPLIAHYGFEGATLAVDRPNAEPNRSETSETAATTAACMSQPRSSRAADQSIIFTLKSCVFHSGCQLNWSLLDIIELYYRIRYLPSDGP